MNWWRPLPADAGGDAQRGFDAAAETRLVARAMLEGAARMLEGEGGGAGELAIARCCEALTSAGTRLVLAWTWFGAPDTPTIRPQVAAGPAAAYAHALAIERTWLTLRGPAWRAVAGEAPEPFGISRFSPFGPWREVARRFGVQSVLALPLASSEDGQRGLFVLYATEPRYFEQVGVGLFEATAALFSGALSRAVRHARIEHGASLDALTGACNRHAMPSIEHRIQARRDAPASVALLDVDHFKSVNDRHGHVAGDAALRSVASRLRGLLRQEDTLVRWGGEEFLVVLPATDAASAAAVAEKLRAAVAEGAHPIGDGTRIPLSASIGHTTLAAGETVLAALPRADAALYAAKRGGRNRVEAA
jgi:diguanylate cyclase (GGDEF)-like protein